MNQLTTSPTYMESRPAGEIPDQASWPVNSSPARHYLLQALTLGQVACSEPSWASLTNFRKHFRVCRMLKRADEIKSDEDMELYTRALDLYRRIFKRG